jgi:hypothetical protein
MFRQASRNVCTSTVVVLPDPFFPTAMLKNMKTPENTVEDPYYPKRAGEGDIQM